MSSVKGNKLNNNGKVYLYDNVYIIEGSRTPFAKFKGSFSNYSATDIGFQSALCTLQKSKILAKDIDQIVYANVMPSSNDAIFLPRHISLKLGCNIQTPSTLVQRICASGLESILFAANDIGINSSDLALVGGVDNLTRSPLLSFEMRKNFYMGNKALYDYLLEALKDTYCDFNMGETAEKIASKYNITRQEVDEYAYLSHKRAITASQNGLLAEEIIPCFDLEKDETIRHTVLLNNLSQLKPSFSLDGVQTPGNSCLLADGAASLIVSGDNFSGNKLGSILAACILGYDPVYMGAAPESAIKFLLQETGLNRDEIDLWEINEAFAAQLLAVQRIVGIPLDKLNVNGGSIAIGHPYAATGIRLVLTILKELKRRKKKLGMVSICVGGGQAIALLVDSNH